MIVMKVDPHLIAAYAAASRACELIDFLPETDFVCVLKDLLVEQHMILEDIIQNKHHGTDNINDFLRYIEDVKRQIHELKYGA